ncbi:hypothetical protein Dimus_026816 [Dionaea muscipula]
MRDLVLKTKCREFYKNLTVSITWKKEVAKSIVNGVEIEFDGMTLATILESPGNNGLCDYIKEVWEETKYCKPLEITKKFANDENILEARRVKIFEAFSVPLNYKKGEDPKRYDYFEKTFLTMCQLKRIDEVWWLGTGEGRRRDDDKVLAENLEVNQEEDFDWEVVNEDVHVEGEQVEKEDDSGSNEKYFEAMDDVEEPIDVIIKVPEVPAPVSDQQKEKTAAGVDLSGPTGSIPESDFLQLQIEFDRIRAEKHQAELDHARAENARLQALL